MPFRRLTLPILILLCLLVPLGDTAANASPRTNWMRSCSTHTTSCVMPYGGHAGITFRTSTGHKVTVHSPSRAWRIVKQHSHQCVNADYQRSCWMVDTGVTNLKFIVFPSGKSNGGTHVAIKRIH